MKEGISNIWLIGIIIVFIMIFACYIAVTISYTATFKLKNEALNIIEKHKGMTSQVSNQTVASRVKTGANMHINVGALQTINMYLLGSSYNVQGFCPDASDGITWAGVKELNYTDGGTAFVDHEADPGTKYYYCFAKFSSDRTTSYDTVYYKIRLFYKMEFPALSEFLSIKVEGVTDEIYNPQDNIDWPINANLYS